MKIIIIYNYRYPRCFGMRGAVLYPYVFLSASEGEAKKKHLLHHEWVHVQQIRREGFLKFYLTYLYEWSINVCKYRNIGKAYRNVSYEKEAYALQDTIKLPKHIQ